MTYSEQVNISDVKGEVIYCSGFPQRKGNMDKTEIQLRVGEHPLVRGKKMYTLDILSGATGNRVQREVKIIGRFNIEQEHILGLFAAMYATESANQAAGFGDLH